MTIDQATVGAQIGIEDEIARTINHCLSCAMSILATILCTEIKIITRTCTDTVALFGTIINGRTNFLTCRYTSGSHHSRSTRRSTSGSHGSSRSTSGSHGSSRFTSGSHHSSRFTSGSHGSSRFTSGSHGSSRFTSGSHHSRSTSGSIGSSQHRTVCYGREFARTFVVSVRISANLHLHTSIFGAGITILTRTAARLFFTIATTVIIH